MSIRSGASELEQKISYWNQREEELKQLFKNPNLGDEKFFLKEKLKYFEGLMKGATNVFGEDRIIHNTLKGTISTIERQLYPNWFERQFQRLKRIVERAVERFIDQRRYASEKKVINGDFIIGHKNRSNNHKISDEGTKQNVINNASHDIKQEEQQRQKVSDAPLANSVPERNTIVAGPLRHTNSTSTSEQSLKPWDKNIPKKRLRHRLE
jgi:hypothetical protein